jgi:hypothetical protein
MAALWATSKCVAIGTLLAACRVDAPDVLLVDASDGSASSMDGGITVFIDASSGDATTVRCGLRGPFDSLKCCPLSWKLGTACTAIEAEQRCASECVSYVAKDGGRAGSRGTWACGNDRVIGSAKTIVACTPEL